MLALFTTIIKSSFRRMIIVSVVQFQTLVESSPQHTEAVLQALDVPIPYVVFPLICHLSLSILYNNYMIT